MAKLTDTQKDEGNGSFVNFVITETICKDPWGRLFRCISFKLTQLPSISVLTNEAPVRRGEGNTDSFVSARVGDTCAQLA